MKKQKSPFGLEVYKFLTDTGMTVSELAANAESFTGTVVRETTLRAAVYGKTPGNKVVPAVLAYMDGHRKGAAG